MRLLVTGGAGFIGANFIHHVLGTTDDVRITNLDALTYAGNLASLRRWDDDARYRFVRGDICDAELVDRLMAESDAVVNFAAESHVDRSIDGPAEFVRPNVTGAGVVFEAARRHEVERVLHISTDEVYGSIEEPGSFREDDALEPNSPYSASKAGADLLALAYRQTYGFPIMVTRAANNFGPYHYPEKVISLFVTNLMDGLNVPMYGDGGNVRDWTFVLDNVAAQWLVLTEGEPGHGLRQSVDGAPGGAPRGRMKLGVSRHECGSGGALVGVVGRYPPDTLAKPPVQGSSELLFDSPRLKVADVGHDQVAGPIREF